MAIRRTTKGKNANYRPTSKGAGMTAKGVRAYRRANPGSKLKTAVTGKVKPGSKAAKDVNHFAQDQNLGLVLEVKLHVDVGSVNGGDGWIEPTVQFSPHDHLANGWFKPAHPRLH